MPPTIAVLMPTYNQAPFVARALASLLAQRTQDWEAIIIDDGSPDATGAVVQPYLRDPRFTYVRFAENQGLGAALNAALDRTTAPLVAYLPSDDLYYPDHLAVLRDCLETDAGAVLAYAGLRHHINDYALGPIDGEPLQLVQVLHRRTAHRWVEREDLVTDDLDRMYWTKLRAAGGFIGSGQVTCEWVEHPLQRHKVLREPVGGINPYRARYGVRAPITFDSSITGPFDERAHYRRFRERPDTPPAADGLTILLVGELAFNPERILALEERGHRLYGLWTPEPWSFNTVGPLPFGHVTDRPTPAGRRRCASSSPT